MKSLEIVLPNGEFNVVQRAGLGTAGEDSGGFFVRLHGVVFRPKDGVEHYFAKMSATLAKVLEPATLARVDAEVRAYHAEAAKRREDAGKPAKP